VLSPIASEGGLDFLGAIDAKLRRDMRLEIRRICKENRLTAIYVTHDRAEALSMADRLAVFRNGRIEQLGTPEEVYRHPLNSFVANFIGETNLREGTIKHFRADGAGFDVTFHFDNPDEWGSLSKGLSITVGSGEDFANWDRKL